MESVGRKKDQAPKLKEHKGDKFCCNSAEWVRIFLLGTETVVVNIFTCRIYHVAWKYRASFIIKFVPRSLLFMRICIRVDVSWSFCVCRVSFEMMPRFHTQETKIRI